MNIFVLDDNPYDAARYLDDKRVCKMIVESLQMLSTAISVLSPAFYEARRDSLYKPSYVNHPCTIWTRSDPRNFMWLLLHTQGLLHAYKWRYRPHLQHPHGEHASSECFRTVEEFANLFYSPDEVKDFPSEFVVCGFEPKALLASPAAAVKMYRQIMRRKWYETDKRAPRWSRSDVPPFFVDIPRDGVIMRDVLAMA